MTKQMPATQLRKGLAEFTEYLIERRDQQQWLAEEFLTDEMKANAKGQLDAFNLALTTLHIWTDGEFGESHEVRVKAS